MGFRDADKAGHGHHRWLWKGSLVSQKYKLLSGSIHTSLPPPSPEFSTSHPLLSWFLEVTEQTALVGPLLARCVDRSQVYIHETLRCEDQTRKESRLKSHGLEGRVRSQLLSLWSPNLVSFQ